MENKDLTKRSYFDIADGGYACVMFILLQYLLYKFIFAVGGITSYGTYHLFSALLQGAFILASFAVAKFKNTSWVKATTFNRKINKKVVLYCLIITVICLWAFTDLSSAFMAILEKCGYTSPLETGDTGKYNQITNIGEYLLSIVTVCIIPPICEETLYRGTVLNSFRGLNKWVGIFVSGFCFMIMHGNPDQTIHQFILGIILGYIAWETRNIWVCILIHALNNFLAVTMTFILNIIASGMDISETTMPETQTTWGQIAVTLVFGIVLAILAVFVIIKLTKKIKEQSAIANGEAQIIVSQPAQEVTEEAPQTPPTQQVVVTELTDVEVQPKPSKAKIVVTVLCYAGFIAYFVWEWVNILLIGLG